MQWKTAATTALIVVVVLAIVYRVSSLRSAVLGS